MQVAPELAKKSVNALRIISAEGVQAAGCGHPGLPMGCADIAYVLWTKYLKHDPSDPEWFDRDRFILSAGHGSMLVYSLLHLSGYDLSMEELKNFRQWNSMTPGHPEHKHTPGVETTTGPLGQGFGNGIGMALAEAMLAERFNTSDHKIVDHYTYAICSDGDLMEGVSAEAASLAGFLKLGKVVFFYDDNQITIEGSTDLAFSSEDVEKRFQAYGWHTQRIDGHDHTAIEKAIETARAETDRPSLILSKTRIGFGSPNKEGTAGVHGAALGDEELQKTKENLGWNEEPFTVPEDALKVYRDAAAESAKAHSQWNELLGQWRQANPDKAKVWDAMINREVPDDLEKVFPEFKAGEAVATRKASGAVLQALADALPQLVGGSADLAPSNNTLLKNYESITPGKYSGRNLHFGVREHGMGSITNGISLHGGFSPYCATFLIFSDYMRPTVRLAALMKAQTIYVWTHDTIFLGEDGPTHQPVEQISSLRCIPNLFVIRPSDPAEVPYAWEMALRRQDGPTALMLSRQSMPAFDRSSMAPASEIRKGGYVLSDADGGDPKVILMAAGSEVQFALEAKDILEKQGTPTRVVAMPCMEVFRRQDADYQEKVLPKPVTKRVAVEAGTRQSWDWLIGLEGAAVTIDNKFGASAPWKTLAKEYGFTGENIAAVAKSIL
jgi:transketolase